MATINLANLSDDFTNLFPGAGGALLKASGVADRLSDDIAGQVAARPNPIPTRGISGPPAVNTGIQNTPAPVTQLQPNPSSVPNTPQIPQTPVNPAPLNVPSATQGVGTTTSPLVGSGASPFLDVLKKRLKKPGAQF